VLFVYAAAEVIAISRNNPNYPVGAGLFEYYSGVKPAMSYLFMAISGGTDWKTLVTPFESHRNITLIFYFFIFFMYFGVTNVVIGAFVATTAEIAQRDRDALVKEQLSRLEGYTARIKTFFREADEDKSGTLSWEEFQKHLANTKVKAYFQALELDVSQAHTLFELLDTDGSDSVTIDEFLDGCLRLKGGAKALDLSLLSHICMKFMRDMKELKMHLVQNNALLQFRSGSDVPMCT